ncbi:MAG: hypothetical protein KDI46_09680 [Alphaproteobacteria bacterium]|nr:hypothetical protein [Alphaproteobacteria bacterium]
MKNGLLKGEFRRMTGRDGVEYLVPPWVKGDLEDIQEELADTDNYVALGLERLDEQEQFRVYINERDLPRLQKYIKDRDMSISSKILRSPLEGSPNINFSIMMYPGDLEDLARQPFVKTVSSLYITTEQRAAIYEAIEGPHR